MAVRRMILLAFVLLSLGVAACGGGDDDYPDDARANFLLACGAAGGEPEGCECALEKIEEDVSFEEFEKIGADILAGESAPRVIRAPVLACHK